MFFPCKWIHLLSMLDSVCCKRWWVILQVRFSVVSLPACIQQLSENSKMSLVTSAQGSSITQKVAFSTAGTHKKKYAKVHTQYWQTISLICDGCSLSLRLICAVSPSPFICSFAISVMFLFFFYLHNWHDIFSILKVIIIPTWRLFELNLAQILQAGVMV